MHTWSQDGDLWLPVKMQMITSYTCGGPAGSKDEISTRIASVNDLGAKVRRYTRI